MQQTSSDPKTKEEIIDQMKDMTWGEFKPILAEAIIAHLEHTQIKYSELGEDPDYLDGVLRDGAIAASINLYYAKVSMGFTRRT